jgi:glycosyltransferase involved in cell wall biosynthesis
VAGAPGEAIRVALDLTPLLGQRTGVGHMVAHLVDGLRGRPGVDLRGFALTWRGRRALDDAAPGVAAGRPLPARPCRWLWSRVDRPTITVASGPLDVVHGTNYVVPPGGGAAELVTVHDLTAWHWPELVHPHSRAYPRLVARAAARGAHVHAVSRFVGDEVAAVVGVPPERVHVVPQAVTPLAPGDASRGRDLAGGGDYVLAVGTVEPRKDYPTLVAAMARLAGEVPGVGLVIAGGEGWGSDALDEALARTATGPLVRRLGYVSTADKADLLAGARVLAYPSRYEGFGFVPLEAMAAGVPVVATRAGAVPEVVGDAAVLCPVGDADALADALAVVLVDEARRAELVGAGRRRAAAFTWPATVDALAGVYRAIAGR